MSCDDVDWGEAKGVKKEDFAGVLGRRGDCRWSMTGLGEGIRSGRCEMWEDEMTIFG
jgi:hypothetical protein